MNFEVYCDESGLEALTRKVALKDPTSILKKGWDPNTKSYDGSRRVTLVKGNYIVVILLYKKNKARFMTAYEVK